MKSKTLTLKFVPCSIYINLVDDVVDFRKSVIQKKYKLLGPLHHNPHIEALHTWDEDNYPGKFWITLPTKVGFGVCVHEATHCVDAICETWGFECTEFRAYLLQWIVEEINEML